MQEKRDVGFSLLHIMHARYILLSSKSCTIFTPSLNLLLSKHNTKGKYHEEKSDRFTIKTLSPLFVKSSTNKSERQQTIGKNGATYMVIKGKNPYKPPWNCKRACSACSACQAIFLSVELGTVMFIVQIRKLRFREVFHSVMNYKLNICWVVWLWNHVLNL